jgi:hypothetical protein
VAKLVGCDLLIGIFKKGKIREEVANTYTVMFTKKRLSEYEVEGLDGFTFKSFENQDASEKVTGSKCTISLHR